MPKTPLPTGFLPSRPQRRPINKMTARELHDQYYRNRDTLSSPIGSSAAMTRIQAEQHAIEARLADLEGVDAIRGMLQETKIDDEDGMSVDKPPASPLASAKQRALAKYAARADNDNEYHRAIGSLSLQEAIDIQREAQALHRELERQAEEKKYRTMPKPGEQLTRQEREARIWAFMNYKPTDSDLEGDDESSDEDPSKWFEDDQDDGRKGQDLVEPDWNEQELSNIIKIDEQRLHEDVADSHFQFADHENDSD